ncbi:hypothetical protein CO180_00330 [candidate division WWE3 bacterium CG_4_9_14_3_um_filter_41_6]|uniref:Glycosyl transferase n=1 Tax=candidate division WWE3 bacterium CG_4_10_14_0_2_um_filter_41_14 TaxID=1975072 RepID=A0A2M7TKM4_UNCKA|nr:MAG: hypothetical protein COY32_01820 [candidate division WWE3 bacterium CG_4_10_14_0_2_um_filter_41_14]PJA39592.1 MAG: hypothetical protein CO180_00330 [candidate division WWE3 bacterium CG_4_9_14_3_um_filter_41_6]
MKIGIYCTNNLIYPTPEGVIYASMNVAGNLADQLTDMGEDVTFFAPIGTKTKAHLVTFDMKPFSDPSVHQTYTHEDASYHYENIMMIKALEYMNDHNFDVFHSHTRPFSVVEFASLKPKLPTVVTIHDPLSDSGYSILPWYNQFLNLHFVSLSYSQRKPQPNLTWANNIYNGINLSLWPYEEKQGSYLLFVGRILPEKGVDTAVQIALKTKMPLKIVGTVYPHSQEFFDTSIKPYLSETIQFLGAKTPMELAPLYQGAYALINPIRWEEPFGLVMIEAMACGTPVIASHHGSVPEIITHGKTGFICESDTDMVKFTSYVSQIPQLTRKDCRDHATANFSIDTMTANYLTIYSQTQKS